MRLEKHNADEMTPLERIYAYEHGLSYDRIPSVPFIGNVRCKVGGMTPEEYWDSAENMVKAELMSYQRFGFDRLGIGPNTRGISDALADQVPDKKQGSLVLDDYSKLEYLEPVNARNDLVIQRFLQATEMLQESAGEIVPVEISIGGPLTIASFLREIELLLRDCRRNGDKVQKLLRIIVDSQKSCIDAFAQYGVGIAMADPVANPALIGPKLYEKFVFPYTKELTDYALEKTGKKVSLHMCGATYSIWKYIEQYQLNEISLDNIVDLDRAARELGKKVPIAGNVDPVQSMLNGTKEEIFADVQKCIELGNSAEKGFHLTTGCDIPDGTSPEKVDWFMEAARLYGKKR